MLMHAIGLSFSFENVSTEYYSLFFILPVSILAVIQKNLIFFKDISRQDGKIKQELANL